MISIIVPVYNTEAYLPKCLDSCLLQTFRDFEVIVVNDGSTDRSAQILNEYAAKDSRIQIFHQPNQGISAARNTGIREARGEYCIHLDSDDYCEENMLEDLYRCALETKADIVVCDYFANYPNKLIYKAQQAPEDPFACISELLRGKLHGAVWNKLINMKLYTCNQIVFPPDVNLWEDISTVIRLCFHAKSIAYLPNAYLHYNQRNNNSYTTHLTDISLKSMQQAIEVITHFLDEKGILPQFEDDLMYRKLLAKRDGLLQIRGIRQKIYAKLYPETDAYIFKNQNNPAYYNVAQWLISKEQFAIANILFNIIRLYRYFKRF